MYVQFRKRLGEAILVSINEKIIEKTLEETEADRQPDDDDSSGTPANKGKLLINATCALAEISGFWI